MLSYRRETGAILDHNLNILHLVEGEAGQVVFPQEILWNLHKERPGSIYAITHIHPPGMTQLSHEDETTIKAWTLAFYPWPIRIMTITETGKSSVSPKDVSFYETCYLPVLESKQGWIARQKSSPRVFEIIPEWQKLKYNGEYDEFWRDQWYGRVLLQKSYEEQTHHE